MYCMHKYFINPICICVCCTVHVLRVKIQGQDSPYTLSRVMKSGDIGGIFVTVLQILKTSPMNNLQNSK